MGTREGAHDAVRKDATRRGLSVLPKVSLEHVDLTSYSRMNVDLAAEVNATSLESIMPLSCTILKVLSSSVANAMKMYRIEGSEGTVAFVRTFDKAFDCLNGLSSCERKPD